MHDIDEPIGYADTGGQFRLEFSEELGQIIDKNQNGRIDSDEARLVIVGGRDTASGLDLKSFIQSPPQLFSDYFHCHLSLRTHPEWKLFGTIRKTGL